MNKLISLFAFLCLLSLATADKQAYEVVDNARDDYGENLEESIQDPIDEIGLAENIEEGLIPEVFLANSEEFIPEDLGLAAVQEGIFAEEEATVAAEPVPTVSLTPPQEPTGIDAQLSHDGEVIVDNTEVDVVLANDEEEGEATSVFAYEGKADDEEEEENNFDPTDGDDVDDSEVAVIDLENQENNEENSEVTGAILYEGNGDDEEEEENTVDSTDGGDIDDSEIAVVELENEEDNEVTSIIAFEGNGDDEEEEGSIEDTDGDDVDDSEIAVIDLENEEDDTTDAIEIVGNADDEEEEGSLDDSESDDVDDSEVAVLDLENEEDDVTHGVSVNVKAEDAEQAV
jgi:hypothetical protein